MSEYWKSTPKYWCKFCEIYVRDTGIERKNHEATGKHQGNIQRSLRELHKGQERQTREQQRAKDEVARLNGLVAAKGTKPSFPSEGAKLPVKTQPPAFNGPQLTPAAQRKAHAEQLIKLGVALPEELKQELSGVGEWQAVTTKVVDSGSNGARSLAGTKREAEKDAPKRNAEEDDDDEDDAEDDGSVRKRRKAWGNTFRSHPGTNDTPEEQEDLDALLSGITKKRPAVDALAAPKVDENEISITVAATDQTVNGADSIKPEISGNAMLSTDVKPEDNDSAITAPPVIVFKKRKGKK